MDYSIASAYFHGTPVDDASRGREFLENDTHTTDDNTSSDESESPGGSASRNVGGRVSAIMLRCQSASGCNREFVKMSGVDPMFCSNECKSIGARARPKTVKQASVRSVRDAFAQLSKVSRWQKCVPGQASYRVTRVVAHVCAWTVVPYIQCTGHNVMFAAAPSLCRGRSGGRLFVLGSSCQPRGLTAAHTPMQVQRAKTTRHFALFTRVEAAVWHQSQSLWSAWLRSTKQDQPQLAQQ